MKNTKSNAEKRVFKISFQTRIYLLCIAVYLLCIAGIVLSVWRMMKFGIHGFNDVIKYPFLIAVCLLCILLVTAILVRSQYVIDGKRFITQYGLIKSKFEIQEITAITLNTDEQKLTLYFGEPFLVISVSPTWNEALVRAILDVNPNIDYSFTLTEKNDENKDE